MDITVSFMFHLHGEYAGVITATVVCEGSEDYSRCGVCACMVSKYKESKYHSTYRVCACMLLSKFDQIAELDCLLLI